MVTVVVFPPGETMSRGFTGCMITWNVSFPSTMVSPKMDTSATQTTWPWGHITLGGVGKLLRDSSKFAEYPTMKQPCSHASHGEILEGGA